MANTEVFNVFLPNGSLRYASLEGDVFRVWRDGDGQVGVTVIPEWMRVEDLRRLGQLITLAADFYELESKLSKECVHVEPCKPKRTAAE